MLLPQGLTVSELIHVITDLVIMQKCRPTVEEVIAEVLAYSTARIQISDEPDPPKPSAPSKKLERDIVASLSQATSHAVNPRMGAVPSSSNASRPTGSISKVVEKLSFDEKESPPVMYSGKWYVIVRGRDVGIYQASFDSIKKLIEGVPNNHCRGFKTKEAAVTFYFEKKLQGEVAVIRLSPRDNGVYGGPALVAVYK
ncbi:hypothetical protein AX14_005182 [Amanita brunnescens Koide BX004]|nr:hypothetical protein AX14_005182 [Amanita brunnescens Koide BX004]